MIRALLVVAASIIGFIEGVVFFIIVHFSFDAPFAVFAVAEWLDYPLLTYGGVGAICGAVLGLVAFAWTKKPLVYRAVPNRFSTLGNPPYKGPLDDEQRDTNHLKDDERWHLAGYVYCGAVSSKTKRGLTNANELFGCLPASKLQMDGEPCALGVAGGRVRK